MGRGTLKRGKGCASPCNLLLNNYYYCSLFLARLNRGKS
jgi:hypothetical protein